MTSQTNRSQDSRLGSSTPSNAALQGAALAFAKPTTKPKPQASNYSGRNGALAAATKAGSSSPPRTLGRPIYEGSDQPGWKYQTTAGGNLGDRGEDQERGRPNRLEPGNGSINTSRSPSFIAATLAASRSVTPNHTGQRQSPAGQKPNTIPWHPAASLKSLNSRESLNEDLDTTSIAPTTSLIEQFEQKRATPAKFSRESPDFKRSSSSTIQRAWPVESQKSPLPTRGRTASPSNIQVQKQKPEIKSPKPTSLGIFSGEPKPIESPKPLSILRTPSGLSQKQSKPDISPNLLPTTRNFLMSVPQPVEPIPEPRRVPKVTTKPIPIPPKPRTQLSGDSYASSDDSFVSASDGQPSLPPRRILGPSNRATYTPSASVDSLATAIVASSLASSRAASPAKPSNVPPLPPPRRASHGRLFHRNDASRTPSPARTTQLRSTMRKPQQDEVDENDRRRARRNPMKKHPHKHHEGDRRRWRDELTQRERKRYEAVWASNKGLYTSPSFDGGSEVCNIVVRDIWNRSRLPPEVLEEVYALVDRKGEGALGKEEFVVGLWLIDQRLKGRKLPIRVTESVWRSVGILGGIKVKKVK